VRKSREDWIRAAVIALLAEGPDGVAVQPLARRLGATKGSFYWHFSSRDELLRAALQRWETVTTDDMIARIEAAGGPAEQKARNLLAQVTASNERHPGQLLLMAGAVHPDVAAAVERVTSRRIGYVARLLREAGLTPPRARRRAVLAYAAYLGHAQLVRTTPGVLPRSDRARRAYVDEIADVLLTQVLRVRADVVPGVLGAQPVLEHLAAHGLGQVDGEHHRLGRLVAGQAGPAVLD
jgi:AcrR family transcriptional regulator